MWIDLRQPVAPFEQLVPWLQSTFPQYQFRVVGSSKLLVVRSAWISATIIPKGNGVDIVGGGMPPNFLARLFLNLLFLAGIIPGIFAFFVFWLVTKGTCTDLERRLAAAFLGQPIPQPVGGSANAQQPSGPSLATRLAPLWLLALGGCFAVSGCVTLVFTPIFTDRYESATEDAEGHARLIEINQAALARAQKGLPPPEGCPENEVNLPYYEKGTCHGCFKSAPSSPETTRHPHGSEYVWCPSPAGFQQQISKLEGKLADDNGDRIEHAAYVIGVGGVGPLLGLSAAGVCFFFWRRKRKAAQKTAAAGEAPIPAPAEAAQLQAGPEPLPATPSPAIPPPAPAIPPPARAEAPQGPAGTQLMPSFEPGREPES